MWNDIETAVDYLHFTDISNTVAELIIESGNNPISIGVSGDWGSGKSSMVKMIKSSLEHINSSSDSNRKRDFVFLEFNAWLYQGYDDAKNALLQMVSKKLADEMVKRKKHVDKELKEQFKSFVKRVNWINVSKLALPFLTGLIPGLAPAGPIASIGSAIFTALNKDQSKDVDVEKINSDIDEVLSDLDGIIKENANNSPTQQIQSLRNEFSAILDKLEITLVVLVDDLDRCLPETAISTLEAMRLLLFVNRTAFIIAADEQMIRNGVRSHFGDSNLSDDLVTSYFDKLIQVPITLPRLGVAEVKVYMALLFLDLEVRRGHVSKESQIKVYELLMGELVSAWEHDVDLNNCIALLEDEEKTVMTDYFSIAERIAGILVSSNRIQGNPRLVKRFLNAIEIRKKVAKIKGLALDSKILIKMLLFERCASRSASAYLSKIVAQSRDGKPEEIRNIEEDLRNGNAFSPKDSSWNDDFIKSWLLLEPMLSDYDLRPLLYLGRDNPIIFAEFDKLSSDGEMIFAAIQNIDNVNTISEVVERVKALGKHEAEVIFNRLLGIGRNDQWTIASVGKVLHVIKAFPEYGPQFAIELANLPIESVTPPLVSAIRTEIWALELLRKWQDDSRLPLSSRRLIESRLN